MTCFNCNLTNEPIVSFVTITTGDFMSKQDTGVRVFMCKKCILMVFKDMNITVPTFKNKE